MSPFDSAKFEALLEGHEISVVSLSAWRNDNQFARLDSEFQKKEYLRSIEQVRAGPSMQFREDDPIIIHPHEIIRNYVEDDDGIWFLRAQNVRQFRINPTNKVFISMEDASKLLRNEIKIGDVLITRTGANRGDCAFYDREDRAVASSHTFLVRPKTINPAWLTVFLNCAYGRAQIDKGVYGAAQPEVAPYYLKNIWLPKPSDTFVSAISDAFNRSAKLSKRAELASLEAENFLLSVIGLADWTPPEPLTYSASSADVIAGERLDAQFYAPSIQALVDILAKDGSTVGSVAIPRRERFNSSRCEAFNYIEIGDVSGSGTADSSQLRCDEAPSRATWHVRPDDVITSTVRPIRRLSALVAPEQDGFVCSSGFVVFQPTNIAPEVLLTFLRLPIICALMDLYASASMYPAIREADILSLPLPAIDAKIAHHICDNVRQAKESSSLAYVMLDQAKKAVEVAIEDSEGAAMAYLDARKREEA